MLTEQNATKSAVLFAGLAILGFSDLQLHSSITARSIEVYALNGEALENAKSYTVDKALHGK